MNLIISTILVALTLFCAPIALSEDFRGPEVITIKVPTSLDSLATKLLPNFKLTHGNRIEELKKDLMKWNPHVTDWNNIPLFTRVYTEYPYPYFISHPYAPKLGINEKVKEDNPDAETPKDNNRFTLFSMITTSSGNFQEKLTNQEGDIKSTQNSPISLGLGTTIFIDKTDKMLTSSVYWSSLTPSTLSGAANSTNSELELKPEYGFNLYYQQLLSPNSVSLSGGMDYEQFSTFNTYDYVNNGAPLAFYQNKVFYGSIGVGKTFYFNSGRLLLKSSISQSLSSSSNASVASNEFKGQRFLLFASYKGDSRLTYHLLFKRHMLKGASDLTINRVGIGIGFVIF